MTNNKDIDVCDGVIYYTGEIQVKAGRSFMGYYGSQAAYEDDFEESEYQAKISFDDFFEWLSYETQYLQGLKERNPELYHKFWDENEEWLDYKPSDDEMYDFIVDCIAHCKDKYGIAKFYHWGNDAAQEQYNNER